MRPIILSCIIFLLSSSFVYAESQIDTPQVLIARYQATDLTQDLMDGYRFYVNPFAWVGKQIYFTGGYRKNLGPTQALVVMLPGNEWRPYAVVVETEENLARALIVGCVGEVLGTYPIVQGGLIVRDVPYIQAIECILEPPLFNAKPAPQKSPTEQYLAEIWSAVDKQQRDAPGCGPLLVELNAVVAITIARSGELQEATIHESSGNAACDAMALQLYRDVGPFPPFPVEVTRDHLTIRGSLRFNKTNPDKMMAEIDHRITTSPTNPNSSSSQSSPNKNRYLAMVEDTIDRQWIAPPAGGLRPVVVFKFRIARSGEISNIHIEESSGNLHYDSAAKRAVNAANPLPPFPEDMSEPHVDVRFRFIKD